jgi:thiol-disulfide isomerase/thioredoxin
MAVISAGYLVFVPGCSGSPNRESDSLQEETTSNSRIVVGAVLPEFELTSLNDADVPFTKADLAGKTYLIDFWATWCLPCVAELPNLHRAYESYSSRGFEILSVAMGDRREEIARLRETDLTMPWLHAFEPLDSEAAELFELFGVPMAILVDSSNTIIGLDEDARGERLQETLARIFGESH